MQEKRETINRISHKKITAKTSGPSTRKVSRIMRNYMRTMVENYFVRNLAVLAHVGNEEVPAEMLKRNSYALLNVSPRFF